jgi:predicted transcriptional regulator
MVIYMKIQKGAKVASATKKNKSQKTYPRPSWIPASAMSEEELCPDCFKVVGERSRYNLVCLLGKSKSGKTVTELTNKMSLKQPTITHHLQALQSVNAVNVKISGREKYFTLNRSAHCFEDCKIPYK